MLSSTGNTGRNWCSLLTTFAIAALFSLGSSHRMKLIPVTSLACHTLGALEQPTRFVSEKHSHRVCKLNKALYSLKQLSRVWYNTFTNYMREVGLVPIDANYSVFIDPNTDIIITLYINNILIIGSSRANI